MTDFNTQSIYSVFADTAERRGDHTAVIYLGQRFSYSRVRGLAEAFAASLAGLGVTAGQKVMLYIPNSINWVVAWLGIQRIGAVAVPITPIYTPHDIIYIANDSGCETIVCADTNFGYVTSALPQTGLKRIIHCNMVDLLPSWKRAFGYLFDVVPRGKTAVHGNTRAFHKLVSGIDTSHLLAEPSRGGGQIAEILYTGGTTKFPKGVPISHALFLVSADEQIRMSQPLFAPEDNIVMGNAPLFHILGQTCSLAALLVGGSLILQPRINLGRRLRRHSEFPGQTDDRCPDALPHDARALAPGPVRPEVPTRICFSGGDVLPPELNRRWLEKFGHPIRQGYGATETCRGGGHVPGGSGKPAEERRQSGAQQEGQAG